MFKEEKESARRTARSHVTLGKSSKNYIRCENEPSQAAIQGFPPPPATFSQVATADFPRGESSQDGGGRAGWSANWCHSIRDHRIGLKFNMKMNNGVLLLCYLDKICLTLTGDFWRALASLYSESEAIKESQKGDSPSVDYTTIYR